MYVWTQAYEYLRSEYTYCGYQEQMGHILFHLKIYIECLYLHVF